VADEIETIDGWQEFTPWGQRVAHYFRASVPGGFADSLCGRVGFFRSTVIAGGIDAEIGDGDCKACARKVEAARARREKEANRA
jgi:hypothetical protein